MTDRILVVEDDPDFSFALSRVLRSNGYEVRVASDAQDGLKAARSASFDVVLLDLGLPDVSGHDVLSSLVEADAHVPVVVLSGHDDAASAVRAMKSGAWDYLTKPTSSDELLLVLARCRERVMLRQRIEAANRNSEATSAVGTSEAWLDALAAIRAAAASPRTAVLVTGESGTGKEVCAKLVHSWSERASEPFVTVNAGAFAPSVLESELFGHEAGAFTGARSVRRGVFELARGGTLFLDELGELPLDLQPKLLRVLDGHPFRRVGGERDIATDVRLVSATNRSLEREVREGRFRLDLYHRLRVVEIHLPALRERGEDVALLAAHFVGEISRTLCVATPMISDDALDAFRAYDWPGNVRELRNVIERALVLRRGYEISLRDLPADIVAASKRNPARRSGLHTLEPQVGRVRTLDEVEREHVLSVFRSAEGNLSKSARVLGISRMTLRKKLRDYGVVPDARES